MQRSLKKSTERGLPKGFKKTVLLEDPAGDLLLASEEFSLHDDGRLTGDVEPVVLAHGSDGGRADGDERIASRRAQGRRDQIPDADLKVRTRRQEKRRVERRADVAQESFR